MRETGRVTRSWILPVFLALACGSSSRPADLPADPGPADAPADLTPPDSHDAPDPGSGEPDDFPDAGEPPPDLPDSTDGDAQSPAWSTPVVWAEPLKDYIERVVASIPKMQPKWFDHSVKELAVNENRLYLGYGDWTVNTGPVDARYFDPDTHELVKESTVDEESIDYFRTFGTTFFIPGVDAKEDAFLGNVFYKKPGQPWVKVRKLEHGVHVLDVIEFQGKLYACGGGISNAEDYKKGVNQASLWRSDDGGDTWGIDTEWTSGNLTAVYRWEQFLRTGDDFYVFGSVVDSTTSTLTNIPRRFDGGKWTSVKLLPSTWVQRTEPFDAKSGLAWGPDLTGETAHFRAYRVEAGDKATPITFLEDRQERVMDFFHVADSDGLFLTRDGAAYPDKAAAPYRFHVYRTQDLAAFDELVTFDSEDTFLSLALWQGAVYLGTKEGFVYRTAPQ